MRRVPGVYFLSLLLVLYIIELKKFSNALDPIVFAYNTNLFFQIKTLNSFYQGKFRTAKNE